MIEEALCVGTGVWEHSVLSVKFFYKPKTF